MEQNQTQNSIPQVQNVVSAKSPTPKRIIVLLLILLISVVVFSGTVILNYQVQQAELESIEAQSVIIKRPAKNKTNALTTQPTSSLSQKGAAISDEEKDLENIDVGSDDTDLQSIKTDLQGL